MSHKILFRFDILYILYYVQLTQQKILYYIYLIICSNMTFILFVSDFFPPSLLMVILSRLTRILSFATNRIKETPTGLLYFSTQAKPQWGSKKQHRQIKLQLLQQIMDPKAEEILAPLRASVKEQVIIATHCFNTFICLSYI